MEVNVKRNIKRYGRFNNGRTRDEEGILIEEDIRWSPLTENMWPTLEAENPPLISHPQVTEIRLDWEELRGGRHPMWAGGRRKGIWTEYGVI